MPERNCQPKPVACRTSWRHLRAAPVSLIALSLGVIGHVLGGGQAPSVLVFLTVWTVAAALSWAASNHRFTVRSLAGIFIAVQAIMHMICLAEEAGHVGGASVHTANAATFNTPAMIAGHTAGTLISIAILNYGEKTLWSFLETLVLAPLQALYLVAPVPLVRLQRPVSALRSTMVDSWRWLGRIDPVRGPPHRGFLLRIDLTVRA